MPSSPTPESTNEPTERMADSGSWLTSSRALLVLLVLTLASYPGVALGLNTFFYRDYLLFAYPLAHYHRECFWQGEFPLWNPLSFCGLPYLAQWNTLLLYPGSLIYLLLPLPWSFNLFLFAHQAWAGLGMYHLTRQLGGHPLAAGIAACGYAFSGLLYQCLMWPNNMAGLAWMPWGVMVLRQAAQGGLRPFVLAALVGALQMLTGAPEVILFTWILGGILALTPAHHFRDAARRLLVVAALGMAVTALAAIQLFPFVDLLLHSHRDTNFGDTAWSMPALGWLHFVVPILGMFEGAPGIFAQPEQFWTSSYYVSIAVLTFAFMAPFVHRCRETRILGLLVIAVLILAVGDHGKVYPWLLKYAPFLGFVRFPVKLVIFTNLCLPLLAGLALTQVLQRDERRRWHQAWTSAGMMLALVLGVLVLAKFIRQPWESPALIWTNGGIRIAFLFATLALLALASRGFARPRTRVLLQAAALVLVWLDGKTHLPEFNPTTPLAALQPGLVKLSPQPAHGLSRAMNSPLARRRLYDAFATNHVLDCWAKRYAMQSNCNLLEAIPKVDGFYSLYLREEYAVHRTLHFLPDYATPADPILDFLNVSQITLPGRLTEFGARTNYLPFVTGGQRPMFLASEKVLELLPTDSFAPREVVYLPESATNLAGQARQGPVHIRSLSITPHRIEFESSAQAPAVVTIAQSYYHVWKAYVNDKPVPLLRVNVGFQGVQVPAGTARVVVRYEDRAFRLGALVTSLALLSTLVAWTRPRVRPLPPRESQDGSAT